MQQKNILPETQRQIKESAFNGKGLNEINSTLQFLYTFLLQYNLLAISFCDNFLIQLLYRICSIYCIKTKYIKNNTVTSWLQICSYTPNKQYLSDTPKHVSRHAAFCLNTQLFPELADPLLYPNSTVLSIPQANRSTGHSTMAFDPRFRFSRENKQQPTKNWHLNSIESILIG